MTLKGDHIAEEFQQLVEQYVARSYTRRETDTAQRSTAVLTSETAA